MNTANTMKQVIYAFRKIVSDFQYNESIKNYRKMQQAKVRNGLSHPTLSRERLVKN